MKHVPKVLTVFFGIYLLIALALFAFQRRLQYFPSHKATTPAQAWLNEVQIISLTAADGGQSQLWYSPAAPGRPTLLFFQGNAGEIADRAPRFAFYQSQGFGVAFLSYRGFGPSHAKISEPGLVADANAAYDWLIAQGLKPGQIALIGESLAQGWRFNLPPSAPFWPWPLRRPILQRLILRQGFTLGFPFAC